MAVRNLKPEKPLSISGTPQADTPGPATQPPDGMREMTGKVTIYIPGWIRFTLFVILIGSAILILFGFGLALNNKNFKNIGQPVIVISILSGLLSGLLSGSSLLAIKDNKIELDSLFRCEGCGVNVNLGTLTKTIHSFGESPSFDIGTAETDKKTVCIDAQKNIEKEWDDWLARLSEDWIIISKPSDTLIIVGSADRQPLRGALAQQFGSNEGLARARAETVKHKLIDNIKIYMKNKDNVPGESNIIVLTTGPEKTPDVTSRAPQGKQGCDDLAGDRKVRLWIDTATLK